MARFRRNISYMDENLNPLQKRRVWQVWTVRSRLRQWLSVNPDLEEHTLMFETGLTVQVSTVSRTWTFDPIKESVA